MIYDATKNSGKKQEQSIYKSSQQQEIYETETKRKTKRINKSNTWLFKKINK